MNQFLNENRNRRSFLVRIIFGLIIVFAVWLYSNILGVIFFIFFIFLIVLPTYDSLKYPRIISMDIIDQMNGFDFEKCVGYIYTILGYDVQHTPHSRDHGADLLLSKDGDRIAVQTKRHNNKISNKAIQEVVASKALYKCNKSMVVTNNYFTTSAMKLANANNVVLVDRTKLENLIKDVSHVSFQINKGYCKEDMLNGGHQISSLDFYSNLMYFFRIAFQTNS